MYILDFLKNLFKKKNIGIIIWLILNIALILFLSCIFAASYVGESSMLGGALIGLGLYFLSLCIALSPFGEWILRLQNGCRKIKDSNILVRIQPLFLEVYNQAKLHNPELPNDIKLFLSDSDEPNAFATGRKTVCVTRGLLRYSDAEIKGVLAHEFGHLAGKDTDTILVVAVGNMIISAIFVVIRVIANIFMWSGQFFTAITSRGVSGVIATLLVALGRVVADFILVAMMRIWNQIGVWLCMHSSRQNEFAADAYAQKCGYGEELCAVLESFGNGGGGNGLFAALASSHPKTYDRISRLRSVNSYNQLY